MYRKQTWNAISKQKAKLCGLQAWASANHSPDTDPNTEPQPMPGSGQEQSPLQKLGSKELHHTLNGGWKSFSVTQGKRIKVRYYTTQGVSTTILIPVALAEAMNIQPNLQHS